MKIYSLSDKEIIKKLGANLRRIRLEKNITQEELAKQCSVGRGTIIGFESGKSNGSFFLLVQILRVLNSLELIEDLISSKEIDLTENRDLKQRASGAINSEIDVADLNTIYKSNDK